MVAKLIPLIGIHGFVQFIGGAANLVAGVWKGGGRENRGHRLLHIFIVLGLGRVLSLLGEFFQVAVKQMERRHELSDKQGDEKNNGGRNSVTRKLQGKSVVKGHL